MEQKFIRIFSILSCICLSLTSFLSSSLPRANAQSNVQSGDIAIEELSAQKSSYQTHQDRVIEIFTGVRDGLSSPLNIAEITVPRDGIIFLNAVYLHCAVARGTCPLVLEALLNLDVLHAAKSGTFECPNLTQFWRSWLENQMEDRHKYMVRTSHIQTTASFNSLERPKYIKCKETVQQILGSNAQGSAVVGKRFAANTDAQQNIAQMVEYLLAVKQKIPNIFGAIQNSAPDDGASTKGRKK